MTVQRIVPNVEIPDPEKARAFYEDVLGLKTVMDLGWIITFASNVPTKPQISVACHGGSDTQVPDISIEVDDVDIVYQRACRSGCEIVYDLSDEDWGVRRFFVRDPAGKILNVLSHGREDKSAGNRSGIGQ